MANVWDVYTVGDVSFIHEVFLGVSHIFYGTGHNVFLQVYMIGMLLGFIWIFIESMIQQKPIALGRFLVAFIIYSALFVPRATVHLEDSQTKKFYTMDNIPLGLAVGSSLVSKVGAGLTHVFEDYFTPVGGAGSGCSPTKTTCAGYLGSLSKIVQIRENLASQPAFLALDRAICGEDYKTPPLPSAPQVKCSIQKSISNYVRHCGVNRFIQNPQLLKSVRNFNDFRYNNFSYNTDLYLWPDKPRTRNCYEAFIDIDTALTKYQSVIEDLSVKPQWLSGLSHDTTGGGDETAQMVTGAGVNHNQIAEILSQMSGASDTTPDVYTYIKNVMLRGPIEDGLMAGYSDVGDARAALMIKSARDQRNIQWAAEENMWISTAKAMATFFEGFVVALVVLIPFVMFMGGLNIMIEYLKVLMWVQLWNPVMAICNLYIQTVASQKVRDAIASSPITDMYVMDSVDEVVQHWIAVGGLMAATTPLLALFILKGSVYTFTTLASRMSGGDHVNEKAVSPDVMQHAPMLLNSVGSGGADNAKGYRQTGTDSLYKQVNWGEMRQNMETSATQKVASASNEFNHAVGQMFNAVDKAGKTESFGNTFMDQLQAINSEQYAFLTSQGRSVADTFQLGNNSSMVNAASTAISYGVSGQIDVGFNMLKGSIQKALNRTLNKGESESLSKAYQAAVGNVDSAMGSLTDSKSLASNLASAFNYAAGHSVGNEVSKGDSDSVQTAYKNLKTAQDQFTQTSQVTKSFGVQQSVDSGILGRMIDSQKFKNFIQSLDNQSGEREAFYQQSRILENDGKGGSDIENQKARFVENLNNLDEGLRKKAIAALGGMMLPGSYGLDPIVDNEKKLSGTNPHDFAPGPAVDKYNKNSTVYGNAVAAGRETVPKKVIAAQDANAKIIKDEKQKQAEKEQQKQKQEKDRVAKLVSDSVNVMTDHRGKEAAAGRSIDGDFIAPISSPSVYTSGLDKEGMAGFDNFWKTKLQGTRFSAVMAYGKAYDDEFTEWYSQVPSGKTNFAAERRDARNGFIVETVSGKVQKQQNAPVLKKINDDFFDKHSELAAKAIAEVMEYGVSREDAENFVRHTLPALSIAAAQEYSYIAANGPDAAGRQDAGGRGNGGHSAQEMVNADANSDKGLDSSIRAIHTLRSLTHDMGAVVSLPEVSKHYEKNGK